MLFGGFQVAEGLQAVVNDRLESLTLRKRSTSRTFGLDGFALLEAGDLDVAALAGGSFEVLVGALRVEDNLRHEDRGLVDLSVFGGVVGLEVLTLG
jgi:hypothetical protein